MTATTLFMLLLYVGMFTTNRAAVSRLTTGSVEWGGATAEESVIRKRHCFTSSAPSPSVSDTHMSTEHSRLKQEAPETRAP